MLREAGQTSISGPMRQLPLHSIHVAAGARLGERSGAETVLAFHPLAEELSALSEAAGLVDSSHRALVAVVGPEARLFLHGMVTNEVNGLKPGQGNSAAVINARGKMLGDGRVLCLSPNELFFDMEPDAAPHVWPHLDQYLVSEDCELRDLTGAIGNVGVFGPRATEVVSHFLGAELPTLPLYHHVSCTVEGHPGLLVAAAPFGVAGWELWLPVAALPFAWQGLRERVEAVGGRAVGDEAVEVTRIHHGVPRYGQDLDESTIPLEANLEAAISYTKGCYVGQEVIAKATYRGQVRRKLGRLRLAHPVPPGTAVLDGERNVGTLTSVAPSGDGAVALAYIRRDRLEVGRVLQVEGGGEAEVIWAPALKEE